MNEDGRMNQNEGTEKGWRSGLAEILKKRELKNLKGKKRWCIEVVHGYWEQG